MTTLRTPRTRRPNAEYRWTRDKMVAFLNELARGHTVAAAARMVGMGRQSAYRLRARLGPVFAGVWQEALEFAAQGDTLAAQSDTQGDTQGDTGPSQGDTSPPQGDTSVRKATSKATHPAPKPRVSSLDRVNRVNPVSFWRAPWAALRAMRRPVPLCAHIRYPRAS